MLCVFMLLVTLVAHNALSVYDWRMFLDYGISAKDLVNLCGTSVTPPVDLGSLAQYTKPIVIDLEIKVEMDLKSDSQIKN